MPFGGALRLALGELRDGSDEDLEVVAIQLGLTGSTACLGFLGSGGVGLAKQVEEADLRGRRAWPSVPLPGVATALLAWPLSRRLRASARASPGCRRTSSP